MASLFGVIKKIFGGGDAKPKSETVLEQQPPTQEGETNLVSDVISGGQEVLHTAQEEVSKVAEAVSETVDHVAEAAAEKMSEVAHSEIVQEAESVAIAAAGAVGGVSGQMTEAVTEMVQSATGAPQEEEDEGEVPVLPPLTMKEPIDYLDRDHFVLPRSELANKAIALVDESVGEEATARALRIFEYGVAAGQAHELRVDREILLLGALLGQLGAEAPSKAEAFCVENGMWPALAKKVAFAIENNEIGTTTNDIETRALALGVAAELANGGVAYVHAATAAETRNRHVH